MAKRFTDTEKWKRPWFDGLPTVAKLVWIYVLDNCDHCGVWPINFRLLNFQLREKISREQFEVWFGDKVRVVDGDKYFVPSFVTFQQGELSEAKNAHKPIFAFLEKHKLTLEEDVKVSHQDPIMMGPGISIGTSISKEGGLGETETHPLAKIWNDHCGTLSKVIACKNTRKKQADQRWKETPSTEYWSEIVSKISRSEFCRGANDRKWKADFDFLIKPDTQFKVQEGKYGCGGNSTRIWENLKTEIEPESA